MGTTPLSLALLDGIRTNPGVKEKAWIAIDFSTYLLSSNRYQCLPGFPDVQPLVIWKVTSHIQSSFYTPF